MAVLLAYNGTLSSDPSTMADGVSADSLLDNYGLVTLGRAADAGFASDPAWLICTSGTDLADAVADDQYCAVRLAPPLGGSVSLTSLTFNAAKGTSSAVVRGYAVRSSIDGYASDIATADLATAPPTWTSVSIDLSGAAFQGITSAITFRIYWYCSIGVDSISYVDDVTVNGSVVMGDAVPYYVDATGGSDADDGLAPETAWQTIAHVNSLSICPGQSILFKRGESFRGHLVTRSSGAFGSHITFGAYGTGDKPLILASLDLSASGIWTEHAAGVYETPLSGLFDIGNLIFNDEASCGFKKWALVDFAAQGDFYWDMAAGILYLKSASNPGTFYSHIEGADFTDTWQRYGVRLNANSHITVQNLDIRYAAGNAFQLHAPKTLGPVSDILIDHCDCSFIGGADMFASTGGGTRAGDGLDAWVDVSDLEVRYCTFDNIFDGAFSSQDEAGGAVISNQYYHHNTVTRCENGWEVFAHTGSVMDGVRVEDNTFTNLGGGWGHNQRYDNGDGVITRGCGMQFFSFAITPTNCTMLRNTVNGWTEHNLIVSRPSCLDGWDVDYNRYSNDGPAAFLNRYDVDYTRYEYTFAEWQAATGKDAHSTIADSPLLALVKHIGLRVV